MTSPVIIPEVLTVKEVQQRLRCGLQTVYDLLGTGKLRGFRLGPRKGVRVLVESLLELMASRAFVVKQPAITAPPLFPLAQPIVPPPAPAPDKKTPGKRR